MSFTTKYLKHYAQLALALLLIIYWTYSQIMPSNNWHTAVFYNNQLYDSEAAYSLNSLGSIRGYTYTYVQHPGTPLLLIGKAMYWLTSPFVAATGEDFILFHLENQWLFLFLVRLFLLITSITCLLILFRFSIPITTNSDILIASSISIVFFAFSVRSFSFLRLWGHGSFAFPFGTLLLLFTYVLVQRSTQLSWRYLWLLGFLAGILTAVQLYFATWVVAIIAMVMLWGIFERRIWWRLIIDALQVGIASLLGFGFALLPAGDNLHIFYDWITTLIFHQGIYGSGSSGITSLDAIRANLVVLFTGEPLISTVTALITITIPVLIIRHRTEFHRKPKLYASLLAFYIQLIATIALLLKHASGAYMVAIGAILPMLLITSFEVIKHSKYGYQLIRFICFVILISTGFTFVTALIAHASYLHNTDNRLQHYQHAMNNSDVEENDEIIVLTGYRSLPSRCEYLWFGNEWAGRVFSSEIHQICPNQFYFDSLEGAIRLPDNPKTQIKNTQFLWDMLILDEAEFTLSGGYGIRFYSPRGGNLHFFINPAKLSTFKMRELWLGFDYQYGNSSGWHNPERLDNGVIFQWMSNTQSTLLLNLDNTSDYVVTFQVFVVDESDLEDLQLSVNGMNIALSHDENGVYTGLIPQSVLELEDNATFSFTISNLSNLLNAGYNDSRAVGIAFDWMEIRQSN